MARLIRPLMQCPKLQHHYCYRASLNNILSPFLLATTATRETVPFCLSLILTAPSSCCNVHNRPHGVRSPNFLPSEHRENDSTSDSDSDEKKSRNQKKREAKHAVRWGMQLAAFSTPQIKRILRVASLDEDVFDAIMLVKRLGPDVREGKRRQFNYIGKLLREVEPELMEALIQATKVGDHGTLQALAASNMQNVEDEDEQSEETEDDMVEEDSHEYINLATRWYDGLISKDVQITNEVYSVHGVDFDRQELRKLVKRVLTAQESQAIANGNEGNEGNEREKGQTDATVVSTKMSLIRFLRTIAKQTGMC